MTNQHDESNDDYQINAGIREMCSRAFGVLDVKFLCKSVSAMNPPEAICVKEDSTLREVIDLLKLHRIGCVLVVNRQRRLTGIFSERDCTLKVVGTELSLETTPVSEVMTRDPIAQPPTVTTAYALNLMSHGGFRHLPLVDDEGIPIGIISVKNIIDFLVHTLTEDLLKF